MVIIVFLCINVIEQKSAICSKKYSTKLFPYHITAEVSF